MMSHSLSTHTVHQPYVGSLVLALVLLTGNGAVFAEFSTTPDENAQTAAMEEYAIEAASSAESSEENPETGFWKETFASFETFRDRTSARYHRFAVATDRYFYGKDLEATTNKSFIKFELGNTIYKAGEHDEDVKLRAKLDLPNTKNKLKLVFDSSPDEDRTLEQRVQSNALGERIDRDSSILGLELNQEAEEVKWEQKLTGGIKLRIPLNPFIKYELEREWQLDNDWRARAEQSFWYYHDDGAGETTELGISKYLTDSYQLDLSSEIEFRDTEDQFDYSLVLSTTKRMTPSSSAQYYIGSIGASQPTNRINTYIFGANYRKLLYEDWLFFHMEPALSFPRDEGWKPQPSITFKLQVFFSQN